MKTEDDTFRKLRQTPFNEVFSLYMKLLPRCRDPEWIDELLEPHGWTYSELQTRIKNSSSNEIWPKV